MLMCLVGAFPLGDAPSPRLSDDLTACALWSDENPSAGRLALTWELRGRGSRWLGQFTPAAGAIASVS